jgi:hypothetical protein
MLSLQEVRQLPDTVTLGTKAPRRREDYESPRKKSSPGSRALAYHGYNLYEEFTPDDSTHLVTLHHLPGSPHTGLAETCG